MTQSLAQQLAVRLFSTGALSRVADKLSGGEDAVVAVPLSARPLLVAAAFARDPRPTLVVISGEEAAYLFARDLAVWLGNELVLRLPLRTDLPWLDHPREQQHYQQTGQRTSAIAALSRGERRVVVASARALMRCVPPPSVGAYEPLVFGAGEELGSRKRSGQGGAITYDTLPALLLARGYERQERAEFPGVFALHGDVLDIYPVGLPYPVRIELFGDFVEVIRRVVPATGQTIGMLDELELFPARELRLTDATVKHATQALQKQTGDAARTLPKHAAYHLELLQQGIFFNEIERYLPYLYAESATPLSYLAPETLLTLLEPRSLFDDTTRYYDEIRESAVLTHASLEGLFKAPSELDFGAHARLTLLSLIGGGVSTDARIEVKHADVSGSDERLAASARSLLAGDYLTLLGIADRRVREATELVLSDAHIPFAEVHAEAGATDGAADDAPSATCVAAPDAAPSTLTLTAPSSAPAAPQRRNAALAPSLVNIVDLDIPTPLVIPQAKLGLLTLSDTAARAAARRGKGRARKAVDPTALTFPFKPGDYVVHATHGIALFKEIVRQEVAGVERDYLYLEYAAGDKLFTPVEQIDKITRFVGPESSTPRLTRLHTSDWSRATGKARKAAHKLAFDLVDLYARRSTTKGYAYAADNDTQYEMELQFPYEETADQLAAIADVKADMESDKPMDRLICGDVGFGKTEVALRAAFKAAQNGKQVMLLCPTTILAQQHYTTFSERFEPFAVEVDVLSRFRTAGEQKRTLERLAAGQIDVLIGTHRLLSPDVNPKQLGLIVIDEEQRFGVQHKEHLKDLREQVDVLTLSATPIPRTMQMAVSGVRDMSLIDTPPHARTPIKVHVGEWDEDVVSAAIRHEIARGGQIYYVSNRVRSIDDAVARVVAVAPEARIGVAHGKMSGSQLEGVMERFAANEYDVLVATTIIESGLDNPHTNTLIIEDSQRLGLAQLYQLKGRVGRSHAQAFAYFLFPSQSVLTEDAVNRLTAIDEYQGLGSGMKIAMRDLEIRGAGSLLGAEQHGMLSAVGFDLFAAMLQEAVLAARAGEQGSGGGGAAGGSGRGASAASGAGAGASQLETRIDLPVPFFLPEEYVPAADERVVVYRRLAGAADAESIAGIEEQLLHTYGALPQPAQNLVDRARARALAQGLRITNITLQRGKFTLEGAELSDEQVAQLKAYKAIYMVKSKKLLYPPQDGIPLLASLVVLLEGLSESPELVEL
ncbi:MAG: transcription-repair coupling factor [Coriobacteriales bacterium]|nr:transcription-repair coupling factor [Coriobacteriales bacterium]